MRKEQVGKLITHDIKIELHEMETILYFLKRGYNIELIVPSNTPQNKSPDILMDGKFWEIKCPMGKSSLSVESLFRKAACQSENVIFDLRNFRGRGTDAVKTLTRKFKSSHRVKRLKIILKNGELQEFD